MSLKPRFTIRGEAKRVDQILRILAKYGLGEWIAKAQPELISKHLKSSDGERIAEMSREERIRGAITHGCHVHTSTLIGVAHSNKGVNVYVAPFLASMYTRRVKRGAQIRIIFA